MLDRVVPENVQQERRSAEANDRPLPEVKFKCPLCKKDCADYLFDETEMKEYRSRFTRGHYIYIVVDKTSSMGANFMEFNTSAVFKGEKKLSRLDQTKEAIKSLLSNIALNAGPMDKIELNTFDDKLTTPPLIPECDVRTVSTLENCGLVDSITLSGIRVPTNFFEILASVYAHLERKAYYNI